MSFCTLRSITRFHRSFTAVARSFVSTNQQQDNHEPFQSTHPNVDDDEVKKFNDLANDWWSHMEELQALNDLRVPLLRDAVKGQLSVEDREARPLDKPLLGSKILDAGCGGGILCEPLARLGGTITGIDPAKDIITIATNHAQQQNLANIEYVHGTIEELTSTHTGHFDAVVSSEVLEHISDWPRFVACCCQLVKKGGSLVFTTINRTRLSYWRAIVAAEYVLGIVPKGTHTWDKFITPEELKFELTKNGCSIRSEHGFSYNPLSKRWSWSDTSSVSYAIHAIKS